MPKTIEKTVGDKTFKIRAKMPMKVIDEMTMKYRKIANLDDPEERELQSLPLRNDLLAAMLVEPKFTDDYYENEADMDDWQLGMDLLGELTEALSLRAADLKKKRAGLLDSRVTELPASLSETKRLSAGSRNSTSVTRSKSRETST